VIAPAKTKYVWIDLDRIDMTIRRTPLKRAADVISGASANDKDIPEGRPADSAVDYVRNSVPRILIGPAHHLLMSQ
jgi:hypothetical protein